NPCVYLPDGRLISKIRSYKLARAFQNILLAYITDNPVAMGECLAFDQTLGFAGTAPIPAAMLQYVAFYRKNRDLYLDAVDVATVGVLRSHATLTYHHARTQLSAILTEQALIQSRVPFHLIFDELMPDLAKLRVLILPDSECLSNEQLARIRTFVENGGGLVAIGQAGLYDEWRRLRAQPGLKGLAEGQPPAHDYEEEVEESVAPSGSVQRNQAGKGRVVYIPGMEYDGPLPEAEAYFNISNRFWKRPKNWEQIIDAVRWAANDDPPLQVAGPDFLVANLVEQAARQRRLIHLVNYDAQNTRSISSVRVTCAVPNGKVAKDVSLYEVEGDSPQALSFTPEPAGVSFTIPEMKIYAVIAVSW
ncbi:MAG: hypothetical protein ABSG32_23725, partial [Terriglobia bacterium]